MTSAPHATFALAAATIGLVAASPALAQVHDGDVILRVHNGRLETGGILEASGSPASAFPVRVFTTSFAANGSTAEPGFDSDQSALPANTNVGFDFAGAVRVWDGSDFDALATPHIRARFGPLLACSPATDTPAAGFGVAVDGNGLYHHHFTFTLADTCNPLVVGTASGVYLLTLTMWCDAEGVQTSEPFHIVIGRDAPQSDIDAAAAYVEGALAPSCPVEYNGDGVLNPDDLGDFITDYFTEPPIPGPGGYAVACPGNEPPYDAGYRAAFTPDMSGQCNPPFPDNLGDYITRYFESC